MPPLIDWPHVATPVITLDGYSLKDPALTWHDGWFQLVVSIFDSDNHSRLGAWRSRDLARWEGPTWTWGDGSDGWCSPDILQHGDGFIMTMQSWDAIPPRESRNQVFYAHSDDAATWSEPKPLAANLTQGLRAIDAALAHHDGKWYLLYKEAQTPRLATANDLDGTWAMCDAPFEGWAENGQFIQIDGTWHLVATILHHHQGIAAMAGDPSDPASWCGWSDWTELVTPERPGFNQFTPANASSLWDGRGVDGYWYRPFCAAQDQVEGNFGWQIGIARSRNLGAWELPAD